MVVGDDGRIARLSNRAGGIEGGMSNGQPIVVRAAMKPIPSIPKALRTVDVTTGDKITPDAVEYSYPLMFDNRSLSLMAYPLPTTLAEKLETV